MELAALGFWIATALGGLYMLGVTMRTGQDTSTAKETHLPSAVVFGHGSLALAGLALWAVHMAVDEPATAWSAVVVLLLVAGGGSYMFLRWSADRRGSAEEVAARRERLAEQQIPSPVVLIHGALALTTILLVLLVALGVG